MDINIIKEIRDDALAIGNESNLSRAFPYVADGLKPSQRAVIFSAYDGGYFSNKPHIKSLKLDGKIVGEFWPHGSEYPTIVRLTQPFVMNLPLLDMHGSNGSQLGTPDAAASRYTEVRLAKASEDGFLSNLKKNTCEWINNYSEDKIWPKLFPALIPNLFINGSNGMGYCYAQYWAPGNLNEFFSKVNEFLNTGEIDCNNIYPDFPTRGIIINKSEIRKIYETGAGNIILRGKASIDNNIIKITELPYQVYVTPFMEQLKKLATPDSKGITKIPGIDDIYNMSGDAGMLIEIECSDDPEIILNRLYKYSDLQVTISVNQYAIDKSIPELFNLKKYIQVYVDHNLNCLKSEYKFDLDKATARKEIVDGLIRCIKIIDQIIDTIKTSKSSDIAKQSLINKFGFTELQAKAIIEMKLGKLANIEQEELNKELSELIKIIDKCTKFLSSAKLQKKEFIKRLSEFVNKYGWERRTEVTDIALEEEKIEVKEKLPKFIEYFNLVLKDNFIKKLNSDGIKKYLKSNPEAKYITLSNNEMLVLISENGLMYKLPVKKLALSSPNSSGNDLNQFYENKIINIFSGKEEDKYLFFITKQGLAKKINSSEVFGLSKNIGTIVMKLSEDDKITNCHLVNDGDKIKYSVNGKLKELSIDNFTPHGRTAGGVKALRIKPEQLFSID